MVTIMTTNNTCNGWSNYETWKVNLELVDYDYWREMEYDNVDDLASALESMIEDYAFDGVPENSFAFDCVGVFLGDVNWREIAAAILEE